MAATPGGKIVQSLVRRHVFAKGNPSCRIINLNVEPVDIPDAIHMHMSATEGMTQLDAATKVTVPLPARP